MKTNKSLNLSLLIILLLVASCRKGSDNDKPKLTQNQELLAYIKSLGFSESVIKDLGDEYQVDGDISFPKDMKIPSNKSIKVENTLTVNSKSMTTPIVGNRKISQAYTGHLIGETNRINVRISINPNLTDLTNEINGAIDLWNNVENSGIYFSIVSSGSYDIEIRKASIAGYGVAYFPLNGSAGALVRINSESMANAGLTSIQKKAVIAHELGHCIGFRHTDWYGNESTYGADDIGTQFTAVEVPNAGGTDPNSIMNRGSNNTLSGILSSKDKLALINLYPGTKYYNVAQSGIFTKNNCPLGYVGAPTTYVVIAGKHQSVISQADADQKAASDLSSNGQQYANTSTSCYLYVSLRYINGIPEVGIRKCTESVPSRAESGYFDNTYHYQWSDGSISINYYETVIYQCAGEIEP